MGERSEALARRFEEAIDNLARAAEGASDEQWQAICGDEQWTVAASVHHVGAQFGLEKEYLDAAAYGAPQPQYTWPDINAINEPRAEKFRNISKADAVRQLRENAAPMAAYVRKLTDEQLDHAVPLKLADGAEVPTQALIEGGVLIDHAVAHLKSIEAAWAAQKVSA